MKPIIKLSSAALKKCREIITSNNSKGLHLSLSSGGCNGFEYNFQTIDNFDKVDEKVNIDGVEIIICNKSLLYLIGTKIDWKSDIMGSFFHFENPNAQSTCGCGTSFSTNTE